MLRVITLILMSSLAWAQANPSSPATTDPTAPANPAAASDTGKDPDQPVNPSDLLPELKPLPSGKATVIGGTIETMDRVRDRLTLQVFGAKKMKILYDQRSRAFRDGKQVPLRDLRVGDRAYVDTLLDGTAIFAKNIRVISQTAVGEARGQIVAYDVGRGELVLNDSLTTETIRMRLQPTTKITRETQNVAAANLRSGSLVEVHFRPEGEGNIVAQEITVLAEPGSVFTFVGRVTNLDMHTGFLALTDPRDKKNYEVHFDPATVKINGSLQQSSDVTVTAIFDGTRYATGAILVNSTSLQ